MQTALSCQTVHTAEPAAAAEELETKSVGSALPAAAACGKVPGESAGQAAATRCARTEGIPARI